jgi:hypothetical protein
MTQSTVAILFWFDSDLSFLSALSLKTFFIEHKLHRLVHKLNLVVKFVHKLN